MRSSDISKSSIEQWCYALMQRSLHFVWVLVEDCRSEVKEIDMHGDAKQSPTFDRPAIPDYQKLSDD